MAKMESTEIPTRTRCRKKENRVDADEVEALYRQRYVPGFRWYLAEARPTQQASMTIRNH